MADLIEAMNNRRNTIASSTFYDGDFKFDYIEPVAPPPEFTGSMVGHVMLHTVMAHALDIERPQGSQPMILDMEPEPARDLALDHTGGQRIIVPHFGVHTALAPRSNRDSNVSGHKVHTYIKRDGTVSVADEAVWGTLDDIATGVREGLDTLGVLAGNTYSALRRRAWELHGDTGAVDSITSAAEETFARVAKPGEHVKDIWHASYGVGHIAGAVVSAVSERFDAQAVGIDLAAARLGVLGRQLEVARIPVNLLEDQEGVASLAWMSRHDPEWPQA